MVLRFREIGVCVYSFVIVVSGETYWYIATFVKKQKEINIGNKIQIK